MAPAPLQDAFRPGGRANDQREVGEPVLQLRDEFRGAAVAARGFPGQAFQADELQVARDAGIERTGEYGDGVAYLFEPLERGAFRGKLQGRPTGEGLVQDR